MRKLILATVAATIACSPAQSAVLSYDVSGRFADGAALSGSFSFDDQGSWASQFSNVSLLVEGGSVDVSSKRFSGAARYSSGAAKPVNYVFCGSQGCINLGLIATTADVYDLRSIDSSSLVATAGDFAATSYGFNIAGGGTGNSYLVSGTVTPAAAGAVPDAQAWVMMIAGLGFIGLTIRRRKPASTRTRAVRCDASRHVATLMLS